MTRAEQFIEDRIVEDVMRELAHATGDYADLHSAHEGYAVILEELDELWDEVKKNAKQRNKDMMYNEAKQVAAMAIRFMRDVCE